MKKTLLICLFSLSGCGQLPTAPVTVQPARSHTQVTQKQLCARISWQDVGSARDINAAISPDNAQFTKLGYGPGRPSEPTVSNDAAGLDQLLRSDRTIELSAEIRREQQQAQAQELQTWVQSHLTLQLQSCPG